jgi:crotonobetainyl-CoA:carnitine CoA-transferase CaiB-like acyl-CoA transferase
MLAGGLELRVLELSDGYGASALAGGLLADVGADLVKVEREDGDSIRGIGPRDEGGDALAARLVLAGKSCTELELTPAGIAALRQRVAGADVVLVDQWWLTRLRAIGIDPARDWRACHPGLVIALMTPFGADGGAASRPAGELIMQAEAGIVSITGRPDGPPVRAGVPLSAGVSGLIAAGAVLAALYRRRRTGHGATIDLAELDAMVMMQGNFLPGFLTTGRVPVRTGNVQPLSAPWNSYPTQDGQVVIVAISESMWQRLLTVIGRPDLIGAPQYAGKSSRVQRRDEIDAMISAWTSGRTAGAVAQVLAAANIPVGQVRGIGQLLADEFFRERLLSGADAAADGQAAPASAVGVADLTAARPALRLADLPVGPAPLGVPAPAIPDWSAPADGVAPRPLAGLRVLEIGGHTAGGMATRMLADLGADVIKVELPQGDNARTTAPILSDGYAYLWHFWNVGKRSLVLDFGHADGRSALLDLAAHADIVLENMALDTVEKLRITPEDLGAVNPRLIYCAVSGFGLQGARRYQRAFDSVLQAEAGIMSVTGELGGEPVKTGPSVVDNATALAAVAAILAALHRREDRGAGVLADVALFDIAGWLTREWWPLAVSGAPPGPVGNRHPYYPLHNVFPASDGQPVAITAVGPEQEAAARKLFGLAGDSGTWDGAVRAWARERPAASAVAQCRAAGVPSARLNEIPQVVDHPLVAEREMLASIPIGDGQQCRVVGTPYKFLGEEPMQAPWRRVPALGQHTEEILRDLLGSAPDASGRR